jgi:hypothetical protein
VTRAAAAAPPPPPAPRVRIVYRARRHRTARAPRTAAAGPAPVAPALALPLRLPDFGSDLLVARPHTYMPLLQTTSMAGACWSLILASLAGTGTAQQQLAQQPASKAVVRDPAGVIAQLRASDYDKLMRPNVHAGLMTPDILKIGFLAVRIWDVNPVEESFRIEAFLRLSWRDPRLSFNISAGHEHKFSQTDWVPTWWNGSPSGLRSVTIDYMTDPNLIKQLWDPLIYSTDSVSPKGLEHSAGMVSIAEDGTCYRSVRIIDEVHTTFQLRWFPFDSHDLHMSIGCYALDDSQISMRWQQDPVGTETSGVGSELPDISVWKFSQPVYSRKAPWYSTTGHAKYTDLTITIPAARNTYMWVRGYIIPSLTVVIIALCGLLLDPTTEMRCGMHVIAVLVQVTLLSQLMDKMPAVGYETWCVAWCVDMMLLTALMLLECIVAAFGTTMVRKAQQSADAVAKKTDGISTVAVLHPVNIDLIFLVLAELDTIARAVFPLLIVSIVGYKLIKLVPDNPDRTDWPAAAVVWVVVFLPALLAAFALTTRSIVQKTQARRRDQETTALDTAAATRDDELAAAAGYETASDAELGMSNPLATRARAVDDT